MTQGKEPDERGVRPEFRVGAGPLAPWLWFRLGQFSFEVDRDPRFAELREFLPDEGSALSSAWLERLHAALGRLHDVLIGDDMSAQDLAGAVRVSHLRVLVGEIHRQAAAA